MQIRREIELLGKESTLRAPLKDKPRGTMQVSFTWAPHSAARDAQISSTMPSQQLMPHMQADGGADAGAQSAEGNMVKAAPEQRAAMRNTMSNPQSPSAKPHSAAVSDAAGGVGTATEEAGVPVGGAAEAAAGWVAENVHKRKDTVLLSDIEEGSNQLAALDGKRIFV